MLCINWIVKTIAITSTVSYCLVQVEVLVAFLFHTIFKNQNKKNGNFYKEHINDY